MMDMCPPKEERRLLLNSDRYDTYPKVNAAIRDCVDQMRHRSDESDPMDAGRVAYQVDCEYDGEWEEVQALGNNKAKGKGKAKVKGTGKGVGKSTHSKPRQEDPDNSIYKCHNCGEKAHKAAQCG